MVFAMRILNLCQKTRFSGTIRGDFMKRLTIKEAAQMMGASEQAVRMMVQLEKIPGAVCYGPKHRRTYWITDEQIKNLMKGETR